MPDAHKPLIAISTAFVLAVAAIAAIVLAHDASPAFGADRSQSTQLISRSMSGDAPNGASKNAVISADKRFARIIAFQSDASDLVAGDANGHTDVFAVKRAGSPGNDGSPWTPGETILVSKGLGGQPANGDSTDPAVDGAFHSAPKCVAFLSSASNLVAGDTNGKVDAFLSAGPGGSPQRLTLPGGAQPTADATGVSVSGNCSQVAYVIGGSLYLAHGPSVKQISTNGAASDPSFDVSGMTKYLAFAAGGGAYLSKNGKKAKLVAPGGSNPAFNGLKRQVIAYQKDSNGHRQIFAKDLGQSEHVISSRQGSEGNGDSGDPEIGNAGFYVTFDTDASNLGTNANGLAGDGNGNTDSYLYTDTRKITLVQSVEEKGVPLPDGGTKSDLSYYANYITFQSPAQGGTPQIFMRYLGPV